MKALFDVSFALLVSAVISSCPLLVPRPQCSKEKLQLNVSPPLCYSLGIPFHDRDLFLEGDLFSMRAANKCNRSKDVNPTLFQNSERSEDNHGQMDENTFEAPKDMLNINSNKI